MTTENGMTPREYKSAMAETLQSIVDLALKKDKVRETINFMAENFKVSATKNLNLEQANRVLEALENDFI